MLCDYKNILGEPGKGVHKYRIFNIAIVDVILTIIFAYFIAYLLKIDFFLTLLLLFILGIVLHRVFCVKTTIDKVLFENS